MKYVLIVITLIAIGVVGYVAFQKQEPVENVIPTPVVVETAPNTEQKKESDGIPKTTPTETSSTVKTFTASEVALHADATSCYSIVNGVVYDLTNWITKHPGGQRAITEMCGKDGTSAFMGKHGGDARPEATLASFKIGILAQ